MAKGEAYKNQHFVPSIYLQAWGYPHKNGKDTLVYVKHKNSERIFPKNPGKILSSEHIYTVFKENGEKDFSIEKWFSDIESDYGDFRPEIERGPQSISSEAKMALSSFTAAQLFRTPEMAKIFVAKIEYWQKIHQKLYESNVVSARPTLFMGPFGDAVMLEASEFPDIIKHPFHNFYLHRIRDFAQKLYKMPFLLLVSDNPDYPFITSDNPAIDVVMSTDKNKIGLSTNTPRNTGYVGLPISPQHKVLFNHSTSGKCAASPEDVCGHNQLQIGAAISLVVLAKDALPAI